MMYVNTLLSCSSQNQQKMLLRLRSNMAQIQELGDKRREVYPNSKGQLAG